jgi:hypothetical protein
MRKVATAAQKEVAQLRRAKVRDWAKRIKSMTEEQRRTFVGAAGYRTIEGHELSMFNQCMLAYGGCQSPLVGGFQQWRKQGRQVSKGVHGFAIWIPIGRKTSDPTTGEEDTDMVGFVLGTVFGIDQTEPIDQREDQQRIEAPQLQVGMQI